MKAKLAALVMAFLDPIGLLLFLIAFLNVFAPYLPPTLWRAAAIATTTGLIAVKCYIAGGRKPPPA